jgi:hypothetical protein
LLGKRTLAETDLRDITIRYWDDRLDAPRPSQDAVDQLVAKLRLPVNRLNWGGSGIIPGGELIDFTPAMRQLIILGPTARKTLHGLLDDPEIQNEVVLVLGAVGDETTVPLLIDRYPRNLAPDEPHQTKMVCFSFALSYLTGQEMDRTRWGTTVSEENAGRWRAWWANARSTFRVLAKKPNASWVPIYPVLTEKWAVRVRKEFAEGKATYND